MPFTNDRQQSGGRGTGQVLTKGCVNVVSLEGVQNPQILTDVICERHFLSLLAHYVRHSPLMIGGGDTDGGISLKVDNQRERRRQRRRACPAD